MTAVGIVSRVTPVHTAVRNCTRDEGGPFEVGNQVLISNHRKLLSSKAMVVNVAEKSERDFGRYSLRLRGRTDPAASAQVPACAEPVPALRAAQTMSREDSRLIPLLL